ncbi:MAG TPA: Gldg family protein [Chthoniobacterales bacterium]
MSDSVIEREPKDEEKTPRVFKIKRFQIGLNVLLQILLGIAIFGMVNYLAFNHFRRWDLSRSKKSEISEQTRKVIGQLQDKLKIVVMVPSQVPVLDDIKDLISEYQVQAKKEDKKVDVETVNPYQNLNRAKELQQRYKFGTQEAVVILDYQSRTKFVNVMDMVEMSTPSDPMTQPEVTGFKGEEAITQALLEVIEPNQNRLYFVTGLGGQDFVGAPYNRTIMEYFKRQNLAAESLNLLNVESIPADARAVFITSPKYDPTDRAIGLLKDYWKRKGHVFVILDPNSNTPKLEAWLGEAGLKIRNDRVKKTESLGGGLTGVYKQVVADFQPGHPITKDLAGAQTIFDGATQTIEIDQTKAQAFQLKAQPLIQAAQGFWGEVDYGGPEDQPIQYDAGRDHGAPLILAVAVEQGAVGDERVKVDSARLVCVANGDFLIDQYISQPNLDFTLAATNWLANRAELIAIPPKQKENFRLGLLEDQLRQISWAVLIIIPAIVATIGIGVRLARRR